MEITGYTPEEKAAMGEPQEGEPQEEAKEEQPQEEDVQQNPETNIGGEPQEGEPQEEVKEGEPQEATVEQPQEGEPQEGEPQEEVKEGEPQEEDVFAGMKIPIGVINESGEEVMEDIPYEQLAREHNEHRALQEQVVKNNNLETEVAPILDSYRKSELLRHVVHYVQGGYDENQIKLGMQQLWDKKPDQAADDNYVPQEPNQDVNRMNELEARLLRAEKQVEIQANITNQQQILNSNEDLFKNALIKYDLDPNVVANDPVLSNRIKETIQHFYKDIKLNEEALNQSQVNGIINYTFNKQPPKVSGDARKQAAEMLRAKNIVKKKQTPTILQGRTTQDRDGLQDKVLETDNVSHSESQARWNKF